MPRRIKKHLINTRRRKHHGGGKKKGRKTLKKVGGSGNTRQRKHYRGSKKWRTTKRKVGGRSCSSLVNNKQGEDYYDGEKEQEQEHKKQLYKEENMLKKHYASLDRATKSNVKKWHETVKDQLNKVKNMPKNYQDNERFNELRQTLLDEKALSIYIDPTTSIKKIIDSGREDGHLEIRKEEKNPSYEKNENMKYPNENIFNLLIKIKNPEIPYNTMWKFIREAVQNYKKNKSALLDHMCARDALLDVGDQVQEGVSDQVDHVQEGVSDQVDHVDLQTFLDDFKKKMWWWKKFCWNFEAPLSIDRDEPRVDARVTEADKRVTDAAEKVVEEKKLLVSDKVDPDSLVNAMTAYFTAQKNLKEVKDLQLSLGLDLPDGWEKRLETYDSIGYYYVNKDTGQKQWTHPSDGFIATQQKANKHLQKIFWFSFLEYDRIISKNDKAVDNKLRPKKKKFFGI